MTCFACTTIFFKLFNPPVSEKLFSFSKTDAKCVDDDIRYIKKATGLDGIDTRILKAEAPVLSIYFGNNF